MAPASWGPRPGESGQAYFDRLNDERLAREAAPGQPGQVTSPTPVDLTPRPAVSTTPATPVADDGPAWHKVGRGFGAVVGRVIEKIRWASGRVFNPKILAMDVKASGRHIKPPPNWQRDVVADFIEQRMPGDVSVPYFENFINMALLAEAEKGLGYVYHGMKFLGGLGKQGKENARKIIRWLEDRGWIGTLNTLYRDEDRTLKRGNNVYLLFGKETATEIHSVADPSERAAKRESLTLALGARLWNLMVRPWGLNATPMASNRHEIRTNPSPA
jgi:hypothetical protein